jgi:uncharacterized protein with HEPN domain
MIEDLFYYCQQLEAFIQNNQIQELEMDSMDANFIESLLGEIQKESQKLPRDFKSRYKNIPWNDLDTYWEDDLTRAPGFIDLKMLYAIAAHKIPHIVSNLRGILKNQN